MMEATSFRKGEERGTRARHAATAVQQPQPAAHAELAVNGVVDCASERAPPSTAAAWDKGGTIAW